MKESGELKRLQNSFYEDKVFLRGTSARYFAQTPRRVETKTRLPRKTARAAGLSILPKDWNHKKLMIIHRDSQLF